MINLFNQALNVKSFTLRELGEEYIIAFLKSVARNIDRGNSLAIAIHKAMSGESNKKRQLLYKEIHTLSKTGSYSFSRILENFPKVFDQKIVSYIAAGERGGNTTKAILQALENTFIERNLYSSFLKQNYLPIVYFTMSFSLWILNFFILFPSTYNILDTIDPKIAIQFVDKRAQASLVAGLCLTVFTLIVAAIFTITLFTFQKNEKIELLLYRIPIFGQFIFNARRFGILKTIGSLLENGMEMKMAIRNVIPYANYHIFKKELIKAEELSKRGKTEIFITGSILGEIERTEMRSVFSSLEAGEVFKNSAERALNLADLYSKVLSKSFSFIAFLTASGSVVLTVAFTMVFNLQLQNAIRSAM